MFLIRESEMKLFLKRIIIFLQNIFIKITRRKKNMLESPEIDKTLSMPNLVRGFVCPYPGCSFGSCQDTLYVDPENAFFSVIDGVSEGMGQSYYVMLLSKYNSEAENIRLTSLDAERIHNSWKDYQEMLIAEGRMPRISHRLYQEGKFAHATYIRMKFYPGETEHDNIKWKCAVLGDSAFIHVHKSDDELRIKHVMMSNENVRIDNYNYSDTIGYYDFSQAPDQLDEKGTWLENEAYMEGMPCESGDIFLLTTDHVAAWILDDASKSINRVCQLLSIQTQDEFQELIDKEREDDPITGRQNMGDDDSTALIIEIKNPQKLEFKVTAVIDPRKKHEEEKAQKKSSLEAKSILQNSDDFTLNNIEIQPENGDTPNVSDIEIQSNNDLSDSKTQQK